MFVEFLLLVLFFFVYLFWRDNYSTKNRPPGPQRLPIIGNLHQIVATGSPLPFVSFDILAKKYGPIYSLKMGIKEAIVVTSFEDMAELLTREECNGRVLEEFIADRSFGEELGIIFSNGELWKSVRRFTIRNLRDYGFGRKNSMESVMSDELQIFVDKMKDDVSKNDGKIHVNLLFNLSLLNVLWMMIAGRRFSHDDTRLQKLMDLTERLFKSGTFGSDLSIAFPILRHIFPQSTGATTFKEGFAALHAWFRDIIAEHRSRLDYAENSYCFVDTFLAKIDEMNKSNPAEGYYNDNQLIVVLMDLFMTGSETLGGSLSYGILFMILYPEVQKKVQKEIDEIVPHGEEILFEHRSKMIYTQATLMEILRVADIVPIIPPRKVLQEFKYKGFTFPEGMAIIPNLYSVFTSSEYWDEPAVFRPERFIDSNGQLFNMEKMAPFGFGKRFCMGETQAAPALFLYFTTLLKHFRLSKVPNEPDPTTDPLPAFTLTPKPFYMKVEVR